ncbi:fatty acyl-CoA reductase wat-like isoform X2 [Daktulosphaira vitifoliae]|uniref:fatty acyl-CoA reductase wat-like isoform X2 n=1 Tax=Daktulosphaira vitifoliae TaxID=58002 RepID=UPI0021AAC87D|nr:fatty acyl-CoA reductase wat-like isoform X2 [Daktulosphaira vitifoliae]
MEPHFKNSKSEIQEFFTDSSIFLTGGTGFIGQVLIEKILRSCYVKHLYLLVRLKKGKGPYTRMEKMFNNPLFKILRESQPDFISKITLIKGDCAEPNLGLEKKDEEFLIKNINIVIHCAATINLTGALKQTTFINIRSTRDLLLIAQKMTCLKSFVYVSTAFSNTNQEVSKEIIYESPMKGETLIGMAETMSDSFLDSITKQCIGTWPNTYTFSKCIAENLVKEYGQHLPITIARPSIVIPTCDEPFAGWFIPSLSVPTLIFGVTIGIVHVLFADPEAPAVIVPADKVANMIITCAFHASKKRNQGTPIQVFNYVPNNIAPPFSYGKGFQTFIRVIKENNIVSDKVIWVQSITVTKSKIYYTLLFFFNYYVPAFIFDVVQWCRGKKFRVMSLCTKFDNMLLEMGSNFSTKIFHFDDTNLMSLIQQQSEEDKHLFDMDLSKLNWEKYALKSILEGREHLLNEVGNTEAGYKRQMQIMIAYNTLKGIMFTILFYLMYKIFNVIFN